jgi:hypothetical protein
VIDAAVVLLATDGGRLVTVDRDFEALVCGGTARRADTSLSAPLRLAVIDEINGWAR